MFFLYTYYCIYIYGNHMKLELAGYILSFAAKMLGSFLYCFCLPTYILNHIKRNHIVDLYIVQIAGLRGRSAWSNSARYQLQNRFDSLLTDTSNNFK